MATNDDFYRELSDACAEGIHQFCQGYTDGAARCQCRCHENDE